MLRHRKLQLAGLTAALALGVLVSAASANRIAMSEQPFRATWSAFKFVTGIGGAVVECHITIEGSFHSKTLSKTSEQLIGYVSRAAIDEGHCTGGSARFLTATLPWHIRYEAFQGTLPNITSVKLRMVGWAFLFNVGGVNCLYASSAASPLRDIVNVNTATHVAESISVDEVAALPLTSGSFPCVSNFRIQQTTTALTVQGGTSKITLTLVQ